MLILGAIVGWLAAAIMGRDEGIFASIVIGVVGSIIGGLLSMLFTGGNHAALAFTWGGLLWSLVGAIILVAILNAVQGRRHHRVGHM
ncbi:MAG TPA: GlsB/YeaQ/YmgE family stress response membrane protein [Candidatus Saccharimonadales bacterium]|nr:GlsB/YeaQ/YmgE family stress response membrane protein [Candidatus Saccharimonadales bacterium]